MAIASQGQRGVVVGDLIQSVVQVMRPEWGSRADVDSEQARETRLAMMARIQREDMLVAAGHFPTGRPLWADYDVGGAALLADREARRVGMVRESLRVILNTTTPECHSERSGA